MSDMDVDQENAIETSFDHKFARDLVRFVLHEHMTGLGWVPDGIFQERDLDTPFTPQLKHEIIEELAHEGHSIHQTFDQCFQDKSTIKGRYAKFIEVAMGGFVLEDFSISEFLTFSVFLAYFGGLSYHYGVEEAPFLSYSTVVKTVRELKKLGKINDNVWNEIQTALENRDLPKRRWASVMDTS